MSGNLAGFDATKVDPDQGGFEPVPNGDYTAMATASEFKSTKSGTGEYLQISWEIIEGQHKGRTVFERLNLKNQNETAVKIALGSLSAICHAIGIMQPNDSSELHGKPVCITVEREERNDKPGSFSNRVKKYSAVGSTPAAKSVPQGDGEANAAPPWKR